MGFDHVPGGINIGHRGLHACIDLDAAADLNAATGQKFGVGVEGYSEIEDLSNTGAFEDQKHRLGPVAYLELEESMPKWEFAAGALFGVSDATSDVTFKFDADMEF